MTEQQTEVPAEQDEALFDAPADVEGDGTGYAVYDRTLGQYVTAVTRDKPSSSDARKAVRKGHKYAVVKV